MKTLVTLASAAFFSLAGLSVSQASDASPQSLTVQFADLDLDKPEGAATLFARIKGAAKTVCSGHRGTALADQQRYKACIEFAVSNAVTRVDEPVLTDYFAGQTASGRKTPNRLVSQR